MKPFFLTSLLLIAAAAHAAEPPSCGNRAVAGTVQELFWENKLRLGEAPAPGTPAHRYFEDWPVVNTVSDGYDSGLKRRECTGFMGKGQKKVRVPFTVQITDANPGAFVVRADFRDMPNPVAIALREVIVKAVGQPR